MDIAGKKVIFIGDSITCGVGTTSPEKNYVNLFAKNTGAEIYNYGVSGSRIARQRVHVCPPDSERDFVLRVDEDIKEENVDLIVVFGGTNDFGHGDAPLGSFGDNDVYTFYGAVSTLIEKLVNKYPEARIVFMTPLHRFNEDDNLNPQGLRRDLLIDYVYAIKEVCEYYAVPVLDLYSLSGIQPAIPIASKLYMPDGLHPSDKGAERIATMLENFVKTM